MTEPNFVSGNISTKYLNQVYPEGFKGEMLFFYLLYFFMLCVTGVWQILMYHKTFKNLLLIIFIYYNR